MVMDLSSFVFCFRACVVGVSCPWLAKTRTCIRRRGRAAVASGRVLQQRYIDSDVSGAPRLRTSVHLTQTWLSEDVQAFS